MYHLVATKTAEILYGLLKNEVNQKIIDQIKKVCRESLDEIFKTIHIRTIIYFTLLTISMIPWFFNINPIFKKGIWISVWTILIIIYYLNIKKIFTFLAFIQNPNEIIKRLLDEGFKENEGRLNAMEKVALWVFEDKSRETYLPQVYFILFSEIGYWIQKHKIWFLFRIFLLSLVVISLGATLPSIWDI